jgi:hypothetical protein
MRGEGSLVILGHLVLLVSGRSYHTDHELPRDKYYSGRNSAIDNAEGELWTKVIVCL